MAWDNYHGRHRIQVKPAGANCLAINLQKRGSQWQNIIGKVCQMPSGKWRHSVGAGARGEPIYGDFKTARAAIKDAVDAHGTYIGVRRTMDGARGTRRRRRRR